MSVPLFRFQGGPPGFGGPGETNWDNANQRFPPPHQNKTVGFDQRPRPLQYVTSERAPFPLGMAVTKNITVINQWLRFRFDPQLFYTCFYNHARRLRLEKVFYLGLSRSSNGFLKPLLDPDDGFTSETAERRFQN